MAKPEFKQEPEAHHNKQADQGLDDQSFLNAREPAMPRHQTVPTKFIMQRMLRQD